MVKRLFRLFRLWGFAVAFLSVFGPARALADEATADERYQAQDWKGAEVAYAELSEGVPANVTYIYRLGRSQLELGKFAPAIDSLKRAAEGEAGPQLMPSVLISLARAQAGAGQALDAIATLEILAASGARPYQIVRGASEFQQIDQDRFNAVLDTLRPCGSESHRAFDFWIGEWKVTSPARAGWVAQSSITVGNDGCSIHEAYRSQGYTGNSINFYDASDEKWHQTWIDNQGAALYLSGDITEGRMVLANENSRITWSMQPDGKVRQLWEATPDEGKTWNVAFDGYYERLAAPRRTNPFLE